MKNVAEEVVDKQVFFLSTASSTRLKDIIIRLSGVYINNHVIFNAACEFCCEHLRRGSQHHLHMADTYMTPTLCSIVFESHVQLSNWKH